MSKLIAGLVMSGAATLSTAAQALPDQAEFLSTSSYVAAGGHYVAFLVPESSAGQDLDGDGMLNAVTFDNCSVHYKNRDVRTPKYVDETAAGKILYRGVGTQRPGGFLNNMFRFPGNAANTSVVYHGEFGRKREEA